MLAKINVEQILFLDIETVPCTYKFKDLSESMQELWALKTRYIQEREGKTPEEVYEKAGIYAEFAKVACISTAFVYPGEGKQSKIRVKSFYGEDEFVILTEFARLLDKHYADENSYLCGHNSREFDLPFLARRMLINGILLPAKLDIAGSKPWEIKHIDTMDLWKFGDYKHFTSLQLLAEIFGIPSPKDDISGADVARVFYEQGDMERIRTYCEKDTITLVHLLHRFKNLPPISHENIEVV